MERSGNVLPQPWCEHSNSMFPLYILSAERSHQSSGTKTALLALLGDGATGSITMMKMET